jgi:hypothetical protein
MKRLFTFGCSFTKYVWPTWADFLGLEFDHAENWGVHGIGNVAIANRVAECHSKNKFTKDDTIVIQWSSHIRHDYHTFRKAPKGRNAMSWKTKGSMFNYLNKDLYDTDWIMKFFDERSYIMYSLNSMVLVKTLLENSGCTYRMTSIGDFGKLGNDLETTNGPDGYAENISTDKNLWTSQGLDPIQIDNEFRSVDFSHYKETIDFDNWLEPIGTYSYKRNDKQYQWQDIKDVKAWTDPHPSIENHVGWLDNVLKPSLKHITIETTSRNLWLSTAQQLKKEINDLDRFENVLGNSQLPNWQHYYIGY